MPRIVVFGADGFIGRHLTLALARQSAAVVTAFDRFTEYRNGEGHVFSAHDNITVVPGDFFNRDEVQASLDKADYVFHLVSATTPASSANDPFIDIDTNLRATIELLEACVEAGVKRVIFPSSGGTVYGDQPATIIDEDALPQPRSPYGIIKLTIENYLRYFKYTHGLDYIVYRIANPYGPGQNIHGKQGVIPIFMYRALHDLPLEIYGDGSMVRDYIYISDLIDMIIGSYAKPSRHAVYNLGSGRGESVNDIIKAIERCSGQTLQREYTPASAAFVHKIVLDNHRFADEFSVKPAVGLQEGVEKTWHYVKKI